MKYLCLAYYDEEKFKKFPKAEFAALESKCPAYDTALRNTGRLIMSASLGEPQATMSIRPRIGKVSVTDGPFTETKELIGGFFIIEANDPKEAIAIASNHPAAHVGEQVGWGIEVRPIDYFGQP